MNRESIRARIVIDPAGCWLWSGHINSNGYGRVTVSGKRDYAHRLSYRAFKGEIPDRMFVCHACDTPRCCNPEHLFVGSQADNMADCKRKGRANGPRHLVGELHPRSKLSNAQTEQIRSMRGSGMKQGAVGNMFGVSASTIRLIWLGKIRTARSDG